MRTWQDTYQRAMCAFTMHCCAAYMSSGSIQEVAAAQPRSYGLSSSRPRERERDVGREEERPWERVWRRPTLGKFGFTKVGHRGSQRT